MLPIHFVVSLVVSNSVCVLYIYKRVAYSFTKKAALHFK